MSEIVLRPAWRRQDPVIERDAELLWRDLKILPPTADVGVRLAELCAGAYRDDALVALSTASIRYVGTLRCKLAMYRCLVAPKERMHRLATAITNFSRELLETWSLDNPQEEIQGLGAVIQSRELVEVQPFAVYPQTGLSFIGYTQEGFQMRVRWFKHARVSTYWPGDPDTVASGQTG